MKANKKKRSLPEPSAGLRTLTQMDFFGVEADKPSTSSAVDNDNKQEQHHSNGALVVVGKGDTEDAERCNVNSAAACLTAKENHEESCSENNDQTADDFPQISAEDLKELDREVEHELLTRRKSLERSNTNSTCETTAKASSQSTESSFSQEALPDELLHQLVDDFEKKAQPLFPNQNDDLPATKQAGVTDLAASMTGLMSSGEEPYGDHKMEAKRQDKELFMDEECYEKKGGLVVEEELSDPESDDEENSADNIPNTMMKEDNDEGSSLTAKEARKIYRRFTPVPDDQDAICERTERIELTLSLKSQSSQRELSRDTAKSSMAQGPSLETLSAVPPSKRARRQSTMTQHYEAGPGPNHCLPQSTERCVYRCSPYDMGVLKVFKAGETFRVKKTLDRKDAWLKKYWITTELFDRDGIKWAALFDKDQGLFVDIRETMSLGKDEAEKLMKSELWQKIPAADRDKARQTRGLLPMIRKTSRVESHAIRVDLLECPPSPLPKPNSSLFYQVFGKCNSHHIHEIFSFQKPDSFVRRHYDGAPTILELFAGGGLFSKGLQKAGMNVKYAVENCGIAAATYRANFHDAEVFEESVVHFLENAKEGFCGYPRPGKIDYIHTSSPCPTFSPKNRGPGTTDNDLENIRLFLLIIDFVEYFKPKVVSLENVTGLLWPKHRGHLQKLVGLFLKIGYSLAAFTLDASHYGDPQKRERIILFASRIDHRLPEVPVATHGPNTGIRRLTARDAIGDLETVEPAIGNKRVSNHEKTRTYLTHWRETKALSTNEAEVMQLKANTPSDTVLRRNNIMHYNGHRQVTPLERARLMGLEDTFQFHGSHAQVCDMIGNGVPVKLSEALGKAILESFHYFPVADKCTPLAKDIAESQGLPL